MAGPLSSVLLGELGARVIKVEPLEGDPSRRTGMQNAKFLVGKDSIGIDLKSDEGRQILHQLIGRADALLHNFRPGVPERLGFGWAESQQRNPRLVYLYGASYGSRGPQNRRAAFHSTPNALAGGGIQQAGRGNAPVDDSYPDPGSGLAAATALMLGLWAREVTGRGQYLETTMLTSAGYILSNNLVLYDGAPAMALPDRGQHGFDALYRLYPCRSGWLFVAARRDPEWHALARALGKPEWLSDSRFATVESRLANDDALAGLIAVALAGPFGRGVGWHPDRGRCGRRRRQHGGGRQVVRGARLVAARGPPGVRPLLAGSPQGAPVGQPAPHRAAERPGRTHPPHPERARLRR